MIYAALKTLKQLDMRSKRMYGLLIYSIFQLCYFFYQYWNLHPN